MKKHGTLNQGISEVMSGMGHGDMLVIADCGLPIPSAVRRIDMALLPGVPSLLQTLDIILEELQVESAIIAAEMVTVSPDMDRNIKQMMAKVPISTVSHEQFKEMTKQAVAVIRTGECTPYANIILRSGVIF